MGFEPTESYIRRSQNKVTQYIVTRTIVDLCKAVERNQGAGLGMRWWEQEGLDLDRERYTVEVEEEDKDGPEE